MKKAKLPGMSERTTYASSGETEALDFSSYCATVRASHELADLIKRMRPQLVEQVGELQATVTRCQRTLDEAKERLQQATTLAHDQACVCHSSLEHDPEAVAALKELREAERTLRDLRHRGTAAKSDGT